MRCFGFLFIGVIFFLLIISLVLTIIYFEYSPWYYLGNIHNSFDFLENNTTVSTNDVNTWAVRGQIGDILAGHFSALAFFAIALSIYFQSEGNKQIQESIEKQETAIQMQKEALNLQRLELKVTNKLATYGHIQKLTMDALDELHKSNIDFKDHSELFKILFHKSKRYKIIFSESTDKEEIETAWMEWWEFEQTLKMFISKIAFALKLYIEYTTNKEINEIMNIMFIEKNIDKMKEIPYLEQFYGTMQYLTYIEGLEPYFKMFNLAGNVSLIMDTDTDGNEHYIQRLLDDLKENEIPTPKIYEIYQNR